MKQSGPHQHNTQLSSSRPPPCLHHLLPSQQHALQARLLRGMLDLGCNVMLVTDTQPGPGIQALQEEFSSTDAAAAGPAPPSATPTPAPVLQVRVQQLSLVDDPHAPLPATSLGGLLTRHAVQHQQQAGPAAGHR